MANSDWWAQKLGGARPDATPPVTPAYVPPPVVPQPVVQQPQVLPQSAIDASRCPGCGSGNYGKMPTMPEARARCYDCGYPITQSGSGAAGINQGNVSGPPKAAKQVATGGWNPTTIIGKIE